MTPERLVVATELLDIALDAWGDPSGPPVLLLHGFPFDPRSFDAAAALLAQAGMRVLVPWLRGFGPTRFRDAETMRSGQQTAIADDARALLDAMGIDRALVAGFDWGGRAACIMGALWPERVRGVLVVGGYLVQDLSDPTRPVPAATEHMIWHQYFLSSERGRRALAEAPRDICLHLRRQWSPGLVDEALFDRTAPAFDNPDFAAVSWHSYAHRIGAAPGDPRYAALDAALLPPPPVPVPAIVLTRGGGMMGGMRAAGQFPALVREWPVEDTGHDPAAEKPQAFAEALLALARAAP
ncbi:putative epoxide hydrolase [Sphingobium sp. SYK-6]|uniref:alpha/beta fold hydrolase n=1 Tax=Sphingobium sp. (strain NBRC 103272 / SYK-6) TaxID=627192 RepID=UPI0002276E79|nr:alpha/beta hydrolase [Sphingobium sp. SYK-6]BAK65040.1 putative epoxide hydrolase [Sphingobium sp. SYK-6]